MTDRLVVVTASTDAERLARFLGFLHRHETRTIPVVAVVQKETDPVGIGQGAVLRTADYLGVVPAFALGCEYALRAYPGAEVIACLHDDCLMDEVCWDEKLLRHFNEYPNCGLAGFGGAKGLGDVDAGKGEYRPTWLVRRGFMSNMPDAEVHGERNLLSRRVAVLDGFSLCFRRRFLQTGHKGVLPKPHEGDTLFAVLQRWGVVHHAYDAAMGAFAKDLGWETWYLPFVCQHLGGQTAVGDAGYAEWAQQHAARRPASIATGDQAFWEQAHEIVWKRLGHLLPFTVELRG